MANSAQAETIVLVGTVDNQEFVGMLALVVLVACLIVVSAFTGHGRAFAVRKVSQATKSSGLKALEYDDQGYLIKTRESGWFNGLSTNPGDSLSDPRAVPSLAREFAEKVKSGAEVSFDESIKVIDEHYVYIEVPFQNGNLNNAAGENIGSAKILAFGLITAMTKEQTLQMFGDYYRNLNKEGSDHMNIRNFVKNGFDGVVFDRGIPISSKAQSGDDTDSVMSTQEVNEGEGDWSMESDSWIP